MNPLYTIKKSAWAEVTLWRLVLSVLIIPLLIMIYKIITVRREFIEFYDDKIIHKRGIFNVRVDEYAFSGIFSVSVRQDVGGSLFNYGDLTVDAVGSWGGLKLENVKDPQEAKEFLSKHLIKKADIIIHTTE